LRSMFPDSGDFLGMRKSEGLLGIMKKTFGIASLTILLTACSSASLPEPAPEPEIVEEAAPPSKSQVIEDSEQEVVDEYTVAEKLAIIDGKTVDDGPAYQVFLDGAGQVCPDETEESLGDLAVRAQQLLEERGVEADNFWLLGNLIIALEGVEDLGVDCAEIGATLISMEVG